MPPEPRAIGFDLAIGKELYPQRIRFINKNNNDKSFVSLGKGYIPSAPHAELQGTHDKKDEVPPPNLAVVQLNKQLREEAFATATMNGRLCITAIRRGFGALAYALKADLNLGASIKHLCLNLSNSGYFEQFRIFKFKAIGAIQANQVAVHREHSAIQLSGHIFKRYFPLLETLDIKFRSTVWAPSDNSFEYQASAGWTGSFSCQKKVSEMILAVAFKEVMHIKNVNEDGTSRTARRRGSAAAWKTWKKIRVVKQIGPHQRTRCALRAPKSMPQVVWFVPADIDSWMILICECTNKCGFGELGDTSTPGTHVNHLWTGYSRSTSGILKTEVPSRRCESRL